MKLVMLLGIAFLQLTLAARVSAAETGFAAASAATTTLAQEPVQVLAQADPKDDGKTLDINVTVGDPAPSKAWYSQPIWIAVFVLAGIVVLTLLVLALRGSGSGSTVVKA